MSHTNDKEPALLHPVAVEPRVGYAIWLRFADGVEGEVDVSEIANHGMYSALTDRDVFEGVHINEWGVVSWGCPGGIDKDSELEICTESDYIKILGLNPTELWTMEREVRDGLLRNARRKLNFVSA